MVRGRGNAKCCASCKSIRLGHEIACSSSFPHLCCLLFFYQGDCLTETHREEGTEQRRGGKKIHARASPLLSPLDDQDREALARRVSGGSADEEESAPPDCPDTHSARSSCRCRHDRPASCVRQTASHAPDASLKRFLTAAPGGTAPLRAGTRCEH